MKAWRIGLTAMLTAGMLLFVSSALFAGGQKESNGGAAAAPNQAMNIQFKTDANGFKEPVWPASTSPASLTVWTWIKNADRLGQMFEKQFPNIKVTVPTVGSGQAEYTKLTTAIQAGSGAPDVVQIEFQFIPQFVNTGGLLDISKYVGALKPLFPEWTWNQVSLDGKLYAIPQDAGPEGLIYRKDVFDKYNIPVPKTWAEFEQAGAKLHQADPSTYLTFLGVNDPGEINGLLWQAGVFPFKSTQNGWKIDFVTPAAKNVLNYWKGLVDKGYVKVSTDVWAAGWISELAKGKYASVIGAAWSPTYEIEPYVGKNSTQQWRVSEMPQWTPGGQVASNWGGSTDAVTKQSKYPEAAAMFAGWLNTNKDAVALESTDIGEGGSGLFHANVFTDKISNFSAPVPFLGGQVANTIFAKEMPWVDKNFQFSPWTSYVFNQLQLELTDFFSGKITTDQALQNLQDKITAFAKAQGFQVAN